MLSFQMRAGASKLSNSLLIDLKLALISSSSIGVVVWGLNRGSDNLGIVELIKLCFMLALAYCLAAVLLHNVLRWHLWSNPSRWPFVAVGGSIIYAFYIAVNEFLFQRAYSTNDWATTQGLTSFVTSAIALSILSALVMWFVVWLKTKGGKRSKTRD
jgi:hypothetical protein